MTKMTMMTIILTMTNMIMKNENDDNGHDDDTQQRK